MNKPYKTVASSNITISELMLPSTLILAEKYMVAILSLLDQVAFASASKFSGIIVSQPPWIHWTESLSK
jgi:hypothetical protein